MDYTIGLYGGKDIVGVVLCDAVTGDTQYYDLADVPQWIDPVSYTHLDVYKRQDRRCAMIKEVRFCNVRVMAA